MDHLKYRLSLFRSVENVPRVILQFETITEAKIAKTILETGWIEQKVWKFEIKTEDGWRQISVDHLK